MVVSPSAEASWISLVWFSSGGGVYGQSLSGPFPAGPFDTKQACMDDLKATADKHSTWTTDGFCVEVENFSQEAKP
jgi:hypothetical protein